MDESRNVEIVEVSARDGIQNLSPVLSTKVKIEMIRRAAEAGLTRIEATSFVNPRRVPQMADAEAVVEAVRGLWPHVQLSGLVLNARGAQRAVAVGLDEVTFVVLATETFNLRNQGTSRAASMQQWAEVADTCQAAGIRTCFMVGAAFGCPFEGAVATSQVTDLVSQALASAPDEVALADTIGCGVPPEVSALFAQIATMTDLPMRAHLHNTRNCGYANAFAAIASGVRSLDASLGGLGGCPFAPTATGNIATEDLAWMLSRCAAGLTWSVDDMITAANWMRSLDLPVDSLLPKAGLFPPRRDSER